MNTFRGRKVPPGAYIPPAYAAEQGRASIAPVSAALQAAVAGALPPSSPGSEWPAEVAIVDAFLPESAEATVYKTSRRWRGLDVYVDTTAITYNTLSSWISIGVYAISRGLRTLVASGRTREKRVGRLVSVRVPIAEAYEVTIAYSDLPVQNSALKLAVIATDCVMPAPDDGDGVISMHFSNHVYATTPALSFFDAFIPVTLVGINALATVANMFFHVHDVASVVPGTLNGRAPVFAFGLPTAGATVFGDSERLISAKRLLKGAVCICGSSTGAVTTLSAAGEVVLSGWIR